MEEVNKKLSSKLKKIFKLSTLDEVDELKRSNERNRALISRFKIDFPERVASDHFLSFPVEIRTIERLQEYYQEEVKFLALYQGLFDAFSVYIALYPAYKLDASVEPITWDSFESREEFIDVCKDSLREKRLMHLFIPDLELMIFGTSALQNFVIFQSDQGKDILKAYIEKYGLFLIERSVA